MSDEPTPVADRYAEYRRGRVPLEQRASLGVWLVRQENWLWIGTIAWILFGSLFVWMGTSELSETSDFYPLGYRESAIMSLIAVGIGAVIGIGVLVRAREWQRLARAELTQDVVEHTEGEVGWRRGRYVAHAAGRRMRFAKGALDTLIPGPYRLFYLSRSRLLVAAEWTGETVPHYNVLLRLAQANNFKLPHLREDRAGRRVARGAAVIYSLLAAESGILFVLILPRLLVVAIGDLPPDLRHTPLSSILLNDVVLDALSITAVYALLYVFVVIPDRVRVAMTEGIVRRSASVTIKTLALVHSYEIGELRFTVDKDAYDALDERLTYRVYYAPRTKRMLNMEPIATVADMLQGAP